MRLPLWLCFVLHVSRSLNSEDCISAASPCFAFQKLWIELRIELNPPIVLPAPDAVASDRSEATLAFLIVADALVEVLFLEIRPEFLQDDDLRVAALPEEEIG